MIPKKIHYCWFGNNSKPDSVIAMIKQWQQILPDYEIIEWNETNYPLIKLTDVPYVQEAFKKQRWAFVTDYVRLAVLDEQGGIYLDTDVELLQSLDSFRNETSFIGAESDNTLCTAVIGATPGTPWIKSCLTLYKRRHFIDNQGNEDTMPNSKYLMNYFRDNYGYKTSNSIERKADVTIYPKFFFSPINYATNRTNISEQTVAIHHYSGTWKSKASVKKDKIMAYVTRVLGEKLVERIKIIIHHK